VKLSRKNSWCISSDRYILVESLPSCTKDNWQLTLCGWLAAADHRNLCTGTSAKVGRHTSAIIYH